MTRPDRRNAGFTLIEVITTMMVLGILAGIAIPSLTAAIVRADGARVISDVRNVELAVKQYVESTGQLPRNSRWGQAPPDLSEYLGDVSFEYKSLDYRLLRRTRQGQVILRVRYPANDRIGTELARYRRDDGSVTWTRRRADFYLVR